MPVHCGFLFNHDQLHQLAHSAPIAIELMRANPALRVSLIATTAAQLEALRALLLLLHHRSVCRGLLTRGTLARFRRLEHVAFRAVTRVTEDMLDALPHSVACVGISGLCEPPDVAHAWLVAHPHVSRVVVHDKPGRLGELSEMPQRLLRYLRAHGVNAICRIMPCVISLQLFRADSAQRRPCDVYLR